MRLLLFIITVFILFSVGLLAQDNRPSEGIADWLCSAKAPSTPEGFLEVLHKVPLSSSQNGALSPTGKYFVYTTYGKTPEKVMEMYPEKFKERRGGEEREVEIHKARWAKKPKAILHLVDLRNNQEKIICDTNDEFFGHLNILSWNWPLQEDKIFLTFCYDPFDVSFSFDIETGTLNGKEKAFNFIRNLTPEQFNNYRHESRYHPLPDFIEKVSGKASPIAAIDGQIYSDYNELRKAGVRPLYTKDIRNLLEQNGKLFGDILWKGETYKYVISQSPADGQISGAYLISVDRHLTAVPEVISGVFGRTELGESIWFVKNGDELLLKRAWQTDALEKDETGKNKNIKRYYKSTVNLGRKKLLKVLALALDKADKNSAMSFRKKKLFAVMADDEYKYWCLLSPDILVPEKEAKSNIGPSKTTIKKEAPPVTTPKNNVVKRQSPEREEPSKQSDKLLLTIIGILIGIFISAVIFLAILFKKKPK